MSFKEQFNRFFAMDDSFDNYSQGFEEEHDQEAPSQMNLIEEVEPKRSVQRTKASPSSQDSRQNVIALNKSGYQAEIKVVEPKVYSEIQGVADLLLENHIVIINFKSAQNDHAQQMIDFLSGTIYAIKGNLQRVGEQIFVNFL